MQWAVFCFWIFFVCVCVFVPCVCLANKQQLVCVRGYETPHTHIYGMVSSRACSCSFLWHRPTARTVHTTQDKTPTYENTRKSFLAKNVSPGCLFLRRMYTVLQLSCEKPLQSKMLLRRGADSPAVAQRRCPIHTCWVEHSRKYYPAFNISSLTFFLPWWLCSWGWRRLPRGPGENACEVHATLSLGEGLGVATVVNVHLGNEGDTEKQVHK